MIDRIDAQKERDRLGSHRIALHRKKKKGRRRRKKNSIFTLEKGGRDMYSTVQYS
jgi:hypothetical protein